MAYIVEIDPYQSQIAAVSLDDLISEDSPVGVINAYVHSLKLSELEFSGHRGINRDQTLYRRSGSINVSCLWVSQ